jgi:hypothetical protein
VPAGIVVPETMGKLSADFVRQPGDFSPARTIHWLKKVVLPGFTWFYPERAGQPET